jgi:hypothetical protein
MRTIQGFGAIILIFITVVSCIDKDIENIGDDLYITPGYSIPLGNDTVYMEDLIDEYAGDLKEIADTSRVPDSINFFYYDNRFFVNSSVLHFEGEQDFDFSSWSNKVDYITSAMIRTHCINKMPAKVYQQVYLMDYSWQVIDSIYHDGNLIIEAAETDNSGNVVKSGETLFDTYITHSLISRLPDVYYIYSITTIELKDFSTSNIRYLGKQEFWSELGLRIELDLPLNEL